MNELDTLEFREVIKKDLGSENSSMLRGISILESLASLREPAKLGSVDANYQNAQGIFAPYISNL